MKTCYLCEKRKPCTPLETKWLDGRKITVPICKECRTRIKKEREIGATSAQTLKARCNELKLPTYPAVYQANAFCQTWWDVGNDLLLAGYTPTQVCKTAVLATEALLEMIKSGMRGIEFAKEIEEKKP